MGYWKLEELLPGPSGANFALSDSADGWNGWLYPANSSTGLIQGIAGPILTDPASYGMTGAVGRVPTSTGVNGTDLQIDDDQTWEVWFQHNQVPGPSGAAAAASTFLNRGGQTTGTYLSTGQRSTGLFADSLYFSLRFGSGVAFDLKSCLIPRIPGVWYHGAGVRKLNEMWLYLNGWLVDYRADLPTGPIVVGSNSAWKFGYIDNAVFGAVSRNQGMSHSAVYNTALTQAQLRTHIIAALGELPDNPCGETPAISVGCPIAAGVVGQAYSSEVMVTGGTPPYTFAVISGSLPTGLSLDPNTGAITGTPTTAATSNFVIQATDSGLLSGQTSGCVIVVESAALLPPPGGGGTTVHTFDAETRIGTEGMVSWFLVLQLSDSGIENRDKVIKAVRATGKFSSGKIKVYGYGPQQDINLSDIEQGINPRTTVTLANTTQVQQSKRHPVNVPNCMMHTIRIEGVSSGTGERDRVDEILYEVSQQGIRR